MEGFSLRILLFFSLLLSAMIAYAEPLERVAFYYGDNIPVSELHAFQIVVVQPSAKLDPKTFNTKDSEAYAYVTLGESDRDSKDFSSIKRRWILGENKAWKSVIMDQTQAEWREYVLKQIITPLWNAGFRGFFLDTLDAYESKNIKVDMKKQTEGMITLIKMIKEKYPSAKLIFNRGFDLLPALHQDVQAFAVESLFQSYSKSQEKYEPVSESDRNWLLKKLDALKQWKIPVISIDYVPLNQTDLSIAVAKKIHALGYIPWVSVPALNVIGIGNIIIQPRTILIIYDDKNNDPLDDETPVFNLLAMPLEFLGYTPRFVDLKGTLPEYSLQGRVAGVIFWLTQENNPKMSQILPWIEKLKSQKIPVIFLNHFGFADSTKLARAFGVRLSASETLNSKPLISQQSDMMNFEAPVITSSREFRPLQAENSHPELTLKSSSNKISELVAITPWGAYAVEDSIFRVLPNLESRWLLNPFKFFPKALHQSLRIIPDVTTQNGLRIMISQVDGDGFNNKAEWLNGPIAGEIINQEIFDRYKVPLTVSIVEAEIKAIQLNKAQIEYNIKIARDIFKKYWIEIATHTYSHPFDWIKVQNPDPKISQEYRLNVGPYHFNLAREITGSTAFINNQLAPIGKSCKVLLWSGEANPPREALAIANQDGLLNLNGGHTRISQINNSITTISPLGIWRGPYFQVFAPITNENIYTNNWRGPFWGYRNVIQTFEMTNSPRRLKPIDIYFHYYAGSKLASLNALKYVFDWALKQDVIPIFSSDYIRKALNFNTLVLAHDLEGTAHLYNIKDLREFRIDKNAGFPEISEKNNVIGFSDFNDSRYIHLGPQSSATIVLSKNPPSNFYLVSSNANVTEFHVDKNCTELSLKGYLPIHFKLANTKICQVTYEGKQLMAGKPINNVISYQLGTEDAKKIRICC